MDFWNKTELHFAIDIPMTQDSCLIYAFDRLIRLNYPKRRLRRLKPMRNKIPRQFFHSSFSGVKFTIKPTEG